MIAQMEVLLKKKHDKDVALMYKEAHIEQKQHTNEKQLLNKRLLQQGYQLQQMTNNLNSTVDKENNLAITFRLEEKKNTPAACHITKYQMTIES